MKPRRRVALLGALFASAVAVMAGPAAASSVEANATRADTCAEPGRESTATPWAQSMLAPERVWPVARGTGTTVAVLDSGVDATQPMLSGRIGRGFDAVASGAANTDCTGTGTQVAGVIAAQPAASRGFSGIAPGVTILPVRVVEDRGSVATAGADPGRLARAITWATEQKADVICVAIPSYQDTSALRDAVTAALAGGVVVVAAAGTTNSSGGEQSRPYPAAYGGVIGVGAIDQNLLRWANSPQGDYIDLVSPGVAVLTTQRGGGLVEATGSGVAAGFVAGAVALVRSARPGLAVDDIVRQLLATATPAAVGPPSSEYGLGIVNPYGAVADRLATQTATRTPKSPRRGSAAIDHAEAASREVAVRAGIAATAAAGLILAGAAALRRGTRRGWRSGLAAPPTPAMDPPDPTPPRDLFDNPPHRW